MIKKNMCQALKKFKAGFIRTEFVCVQKGMERELKPSKQTEIGG